MKTLEKHLLILEPLLEELAPLGYFRKGKQLWHINRQEGYAILIEAEMYTRGTYKQVLIQYGSFWKDISASSQGGVFLGSVLALDDRCIPFPTFGIENAEEPEQLVRASAPYMVDQVKTTVLPILRDIHDLPSFVKASEALDAQNAGVISWPRGERVWDYLALGDRSAARDYLHRLLRYSWRDVLETIIAALSPDKQAEVRRYNEQRASLMDCAEQQSRERLQHLLDDIAAMDDAQLAQVLQTRRARSEAALAANLGPRRWNQL